MSKLKVIGLAAICLIGLTNAMLWTAVAVDIYIAMQNREKTAMFGVNANDQTFVLSLILGLMGMFVYAVTVWSVKFNQDGNQETTNQ